MTERNKIPFVTQLLVCARNEEASERDGGAAERKGKHLRRAPLKTKQASGMSAGRKLHGCKLAAFAS